MGSGSIATYLVWVRRWCSHWRALRVDDLRHLTLAGVLAFASALVSRRIRRPVRPATRAAARNSLHAWACGVRALGTVVPRWCPDVPKPRLPALLDEYSKYRRSHRGVAGSTIRRDLAIASEFLTRLRSRGRRIATATIVDVDAFVDGMLDRWSRSTAADGCSSLRGFLRFLRATGRLRHDLATSVVGPRVRVAARPPRALAWTDVRRILRAVPRRRPADLRDYAMLLLLASYGMGASEVATLRLEDIHWTAKVLFVRRSKTGVPVKLPLLPAVARALAVYLRRGRPRHSVAREVFLTVGLPHYAIAPSALRHQVRKYASLAGIPSEFRGSHVLRHSHATRQIDLGATPKVVSDILGHRRPSSTSVYVRVALRRLRSLALPVPR